MAQNILLADRTLGSDEYFCSIVRIGEIFPIEGADKIAVTKINNIPIVIKKNEVKTGDIMFYAPLGSALCDKFLSSNNMYNLCIWEKNANAEEARPFVEKYMALRDTDKKNKEAVEAAKKDARNYTGVFDQYGQVSRMVLMGITSRGFLFGINEMAKCAPEIMDINLEELVDTDFNVVNGELFIQAFIPPIKDRKRRDRRDKKRKQHKPIKSQSRIIPGKGLVRHYETNRMNKVQYINIVQPDDVIAVSTKIHGTSFIIGNFEVKKPKWDGLYSKLFYMGVLPKFLKRTTTNYDVLYSTKNHVINDDINPEKNRRRGRSKSILKYTEYYELLKNYIPKGITLYGEIFGYVTGQNTSYIQKSYDYGCKPGTNKLMVYRITQIMDDESIKEYNISEVEAYMRELLLNVPELSGRIMLMDIGFYGKASDLYPEIVIDEKWNENFLNAISNDKKRFHMEENEPLCKNKVPREGVVVRIDNDKEPRAFKVKCLKFTDKEYEEINKGTYEDTEAYEAQIDIDEENE